MLFIVTSFNYGDRATLSLLVLKWPKISPFDPVGMGCVFSAFSWAYVIGQILCWSCWIVLPKTPSTSVDLYLVDVYLCCASPISLVDSALSLPCLHCASRRSLKRLLPRQQPHCCGLLCAGKGNGGVDFLTPPNTSQRLSSRRLWPLFREVGWSVSSSLWAVCITARQPFCRKSSTSQINIRA